MINSNYMRKLVHLFLFTILTHVECQEVVIRSPEGQLSVLKIEPQDTFSQVVDFLQSHYNNTSEFLLDFMTLATGYQPQKSASVFRNYLIPIDAYEKEKICYIVTTLGFGSLTKIAKSRSSLKKAGKLIDHVHPLRFLQCVFTDEEMKAAIHAMVNRNWIWDEFFNGLRDSLEEESNRNNLPPEYVNDFASQIGIDPDLIYSSIISHQWNQFITGLINNVPRLTNNDRYDM